MSATKSLSPAPPGIELSPACRAEFEEILTPEALEFVADLERLTRSTRRQLLCARARPAGAARRRRAARLPARDGRDSPRRLADRAGSGRPAGSPRGDHRPGRSQDGDQRAQLRREDVHGRLRGFARATWQATIAGQVNLRDAVSGTIEFTNAPGQALCAGQADGHAVGPAARLAPGGKARAGRRPADVGRHLRLRPVLFPQRPGADRQGHAARTSTCRSWRATWKPGCGTTCSDRPR